MHTSRNTILYPGLLWALFMMLMLQCTTSQRARLVPSYQLMPIDISYLPDSLAEATIQPYREQLLMSMDQVIGISKKRLTEAPVESPLGNFVADAILVQAGDYYSQKIDLSVINNGGLRAPIPQGPVKLSHIYELMPFENTLYILELNGAQTRALFDLLARDQRMAIANSVAIVQNRRATKIFIDGAPFVDQKTYTLAVSDYLAQGGGGMDFLSEAKVLATKDVKIRDLIIEYIKRLEADGIEIDAEIEGRVKLIPEQ